MIAPKYRSGGTGLSFGALASGIVLASTTPVLVAGATLEALAVAAWRIWFAGAVFAALTLSRRRLSWRALRVTLPAGFAFGVATALFFSALQLTSVANATVISVTQPLPLVVAARFMFGERIVRADVGWISAALGGTIFMVLAAASGGTADLGGDLVAAGSTLAAAGYLAFAKLSRETLDTDVFMTGLLLWSGVVITPVALLSGQEMVPPDATEWVRMVCLGFIVGVAHGLINFANGRLPLAVVGLFLLAVPVSSGLLAWIFLDQQVTGWQVLGMAVVLVSLAAHTRFTANIDRSLQR